jgi:histone H3/H4
VEETSEAELEDISSQLRKLLRHKPQGTLFRHSRKTSKQKKGKSKGRNSTSLKDMEIDSPHFEILKRNFIQMVAKIVKEKEYNVIFQREALEIIQESAENFIIGKFSDANHCAETHHRQTIKKEDLE